MSWVPDLDHDKALASSSGPIAGRSHWTQHVDRSILPRCGNMRRVKVLPDHAASVTTHRAFVSIRRVPTSFFGLFSEGANSRRRMRCANLQLRIKLT